MMSNEKVENGVIFSISMTKLPLKSTLLPPLHIIILAAGSGSRMHSPATPKVLHKIGGRSLLARVIDTSRVLQPTCIHVVYGKNGERLQQAINQQCQSISGANRVKDSGEQEGDYFQPSLQPSLNWVAQPAQLGTGHAVQQVLPHLPGESKEENSVVIILYGDVPLITGRTLCSLLVQRQQQTQLDGITLLTANVSDPAGYGRIVRDERNGNKITAIVEEKDASPAERLISEINSGIICTTASLLRRYLPRLQARNQQGEYYLTDIVALALADGYAIDNISVTDLFEIAGVNDKMQLAMLERAYQRGVAEQLLRQGVTVLDPARLDVRESEGGAGAVHDENVGASELLPHNLRCAADVTLDVNVVLEGAVSIGANSYIGANCYIKDTIIGSNVTVRPNSVIEGAEISDDSVIGPFARIRPGSYIARGAHVGNFVEIKNATLGAGSKANHLSYVGDAVVGERVNIGAGTITCNYDGVNKHQTIIEDGAFIGSNSQLVAPVRIGKNATIGAGSTITRDAPEDKLTLTRAQQVTVEGWKRPAKLVREEE